MKDSTSVRPCAEFPCDNPKLHSVGVWASGSDPGPEHDVDSSGEWGVSDHWVHAVRLRWAKARIDAPEAQLPVLDAGALDVSTTSGTTFEEIEADPFIEELLGFVVEPPTEMPPLDFDGQLVDFAPEESGDFAVMPDVAEQSTTAPGEWPEAGAVTGERLVGVQPLVPLAIELTPTPMGVSSWSELTGKLSRYLLDTGHTRAAALVTPMLNGELVELSRLDPRALECLLSDGVAEVRGGRPVTSARFRESARAFRETFSEGGLNADDALFWLSQLLVALGGGSADDVMLENALRELGVAELLECAA